MREKRKRYTPAKKTKIALEAIKGELTLAQITHKYGVHATQVNTWEKQALTYLPAPLATIKNKKLRHMKTNWASFMSKLVD